MSTPTYISEKQVLKALNWPLVNEAVEEALKAELYQPNDSKTKHESSIYNQPQRNIVFAGEPSKLLLTMPGFVGNYGKQRKHNTLACKLITSFSQSKPRIQANICLFDSENGTLNCIMAATNITAWRTASASIISTKYLYFQRLQLPITTSIKLSIIGCGTQGRSHAMGMCSKFNVSEVKLWNRTTNKAEDLAKDLKQQYGDKIQITVATNPTEAVSQADVICVSTNSPQALIDYNMLQKKDIHITTVGAGQVHYGEVGQNIYDVSEVYVDSMISAEKELKGLKANIIGEVGAIINGKLQQPLNQGITIFQSMGK